MRLKGLGCLCLSFVLLSCSPASSLVLPSDTPTVEVSPTAGASPTHSATRLPSVTEKATPTPSATPTSLPSPSLTVEPTASPTVSVSPTLSPTASLSVVATTAPQAQTPPDGARAPKVYETTLMIPTYDYVSAFQETQAGDAVYPYPRLDGTKVGPPVPQSYRAIVLENQYVAVTILPELGGRLYRWLDKTTGRHLLYENPVIKPTQWGYRGWWLAAGGIEWAFPVEEHGLNEWRPWLYSIGVTQHGQSVTVYDIEDQTGMDVGVTISLDADHAYMTLQPWARNNTEEAHLYQLWLNAMVAMTNNRVSDETEIVIPADQVVVHSTADPALPGPWQTMTWPLYAGRDMRWYRNWQGYLGFFVPAACLRQALPATTSFVGLYDHVSDQGVVRIFTPGWPRGTKFFGPATLPPSLWTDDDSDYIELWSGATASFADYATLNPGESVTWTERWYPVSGLGGLHYANASAALRLDTLPAGAEIGVGVSSFMTGKLTLWAGETAAAVWDVKLAPGQTFQAQWARPAGVQGALALTLEAWDGRVVARLE